MGLWSKLSAWAASGAKSADQVRIQTTKNVRRQTTKVMRDVKSTSNALITKATSDETLQKVCIGSTLISQGTGALSQILGMVLTIRQIRR